MSALFPNTDYTDVDDLYEEIKYVDAGVTNKDRKNASSGQRKQQQESTGILKKAAKRHNDVGQGQSSPRYLDIFNSVLPSSVQKSRHSESVYQIGTVSRAHTDEASDTYSYAVSHDIVREFDKTDELLKELVVNGGQKASPAKPGTTSLHDDYTQDLLSTSGWQSASKNPELPGISTEVEGIYALAKDYENQPKPMQAQEPETETDDLCYDHLRGTTQKSSLQDYDHVTGWSESVDTTVDNANACHLSDISLPWHQYANVPNRDIVAMSGNKMPCAHQPGLVPDYEVPWDSKMGQQKLNILIKQAENRHTQRPSIDDTYQDVIPKSKVTAVDKPCVTKLKSASVSASAEGYETSWGESVSTQEHSQSDNRLPENVLLPTGKFTNQTNSDSSIAKQAWNIPSQQKSPEIKVVEKLKSDQARRGLSSLWQGSASENSVGVSVLSAKQSALNSPNQLRTVSDCAAKSGDCSMAGLLQNKDITVPLENQTYYHGAIKRSEAEKKLLWLKEGSYLIRRSESNKDDYSLTLSGMNRVAMHMKIEHKPDGRYILGENSPPFTSIPEMVDYYTKHKLPVQNADSICLIYPVHTR